MSFLGLGSAIVVQIKVDAKPDRKPRTVVFEGGGREELAVHCAGEAISGSVVVSPKSGRSVAYLGIKLELIGLVELYYDKSSSFTFLNSVRELEPAGTISRVMTYPFRFEDFEVKHESYNGANVRCRYYLKCTISRQYSMATPTEQDVWFVSPVDPPTSTSLLKMEVGIDRCLLLEFAFQKNAYHLDEVVFGKVSFALVSLRIKTMELSMVRKESVGSSEENKTTSSETVGKFELMDGSPHKGEVVPIRTFLSSFNLTPTMENVENLFSVQYALSIVIVDASDRRYFKEVPVRFWRKEL